ncbi:TPA: tail fiber assembly protein [Citrobacter braakii]|uniref:tail fiber assembly protein n=1 Tax=Citrobacter sp. Cb220 TaxID=2985034 RepID=UPI0025763F64|nr:tail fiber assembly protein [Citrobacter sp. Cb220]MDM3316396.1 tail fiber assembly protein [Citrobacter sp. Cb220]HEM7929932.1 tail fiber assembly protein [Citrobacter braakii]HEM7959568.1 tail fiber assembly protein [Citrobacter braakii]
MINYYYSATNNVFVTAGSTLLSEPGFSDAVPVDDVVFDEYFRTIKDGMRRVAGDDGLPAWQKIPPPTPEEIKADTLAEAELKKSVLKAAADSEIEWRQDAVDAGIATEEEATALVEWKKYRVLLMRVDTSTAPDIEWPITPGE